MRWNQLIWCGILVGIALFKFSPRALTATQALPQQPPPQHQHNAQAHTLSIAVDGRVHPEQIPDEIAFRHWLSALAVASNASDNDVKRRNAFLAQVGLSQEDSARLVQSLVGVRETLNAIESARKSLPPVSQVNQVASDRMLALRAQQSQALDAARSRIEGAVGSDGVRLIQKHVREHVKSHIVLYSDAPNN